MSYRHLALAVLMVVGTSAARAQSATPRLAGPTASAAILTTSRATTAGFDQATLGHDAMQRAAGRPNVTGGIIGFVLGAAAGATVGCLANKDDYGVFCAGQNDTRVVAGALVGGAVGAAVGALLFKRE
jgi:hypothetical protein